MYKRLIQPIDNAPLVLFRIVFGFLFVCESFGAIATGWVSENLIVPQWTFAHIHMDWLQPLPGWGMYGYFAVMGLASIGVMVGYRYRASVILLTLLWAGSYFMQKTSYNNHYYLMLVLSFYMCFMPAAHYASLDVKRGAVSEKLSMPWACAFVFIAQISVMYFYATVAKFYPDWLDGTFVGNLYRGLQVAEPLKVLFNDKRFYLSIAYLGIAFDALIVPLLLWKKTRTGAVIASLFFHIFNSISLQIGVFPYFGLSFALFFYKPDDIRRWFFKSKPALKSDLEAVSIPKFTLYFFALLVLLQVLLPLRHWAIPGDVLWTEEGHRLSWRMMLRQRSGYIAFRVVDKSNGQEVAYDLKESLTDRQIAGLNTPDMVWQMAQKIKREYQAKHIDVAVYADCWVSVNQRPVSRFIDLEVDLAQEKWKYFGHQSWILAEPF